MKILFIGNSGSDFAKCLSFCADVSFMSESQAIQKGIDGFDAYCIAGKYPSADTLISPRLRVLLEDKAENGYKIFLEQPLSFLNIYSAGPECTVRSRLVYVGDEAIPGIEVGDILDDQANFAAEPWFNVDGVVPLFVYREHIIAHTHTDMTVEEIKKDSKYGIWKYGENVLMTSFLIRDFGKSGFAPYKKWQGLISWICKWLCGKEPSYFPEAPVQYKLCEKLNEKSHRTAIDKGIKWLEQFLINDGIDGLYEGVSHNISPDGKRTLLREIRTDCAGETAGAFRAYYRISGDKKYLKYAENLESFIFGPMQVNGGLFDGMHRWTASGWGVCYQDDVARAVLPTLYNAYFYNEKNNLDNVYRSLDFLLKITCRDGCAPFRTDCKDMQTEADFVKRSEKEHGLHSAHYNAFYHSALLLGYLCGGRHEYLDTAEKGLTAIMEDYPDTKREQSETEEICRLIPALALLYMCTKKSEHREMLYRVTDDLQKFRHSFGGYCEWDTGYTASCSRESTGECSVLSENGDPITDSLYSSNWLPIGFALCYKATGDEIFRKYWADIVEFYIRVQMHSDNKLTDGAWSRAFDMDLCEAYANPHDVGWAANSIETGWTVAEILMGMMFFD